MPQIDLTDSELQQAARATRIARRQAEQDAERQGKPSTRAILEANAQRYEKLAAKFEQARKSGISP
jgi:hypothetical protein